MIMNMKVQFLDYIVSDSNMHCYTFLSLDYKLPFTVYSMTLIDSYKKLEQLKIYDLPFDFVLKQDKTGIKWKVKGVDNVK